MSKYVLYCPCCGDFVIKETRDEKVSFCKRCGFREPLVNTAQNETYEELCEEASKVFGEYSWNTLSKLLEQKYHITENPLYNKEIADYVTKKEEEESRARKAQRIAARQRAEEAAKPHCPTCGSTNIKKLDILDRAVSVGIFGLASNKINKSFKCKNCGHTW